MVDAQSGHEATLTALLPALAGANMIYGLGMLEGGLTWDYAQLLLENDMAGMILKTLRGIPMDEKHMSLDVIAEVGPGGEFISNSHTFENFHSLSAPSLLDRNSYDTWLERSKGKDIYERAYEKAIDMLENGKIEEPLPDHIRKELCNVLEEATAETEELLAKEKED